MKTIKIKDSYIKLDQFLKYTSISSTGGESKYLIQEEMVKVNGEVETKRGRKLKTKDIVTVKGIDEEFIIE